MLLALQRKRTFQQHLQPTTRETLLNATLSPVLRLCFCMDNSLYLSKPKTCKIHRHTVSNYTQNKDPPPDRKHGGFLVLCPERPNSALTPERYRRLEIQKRRHQKQIDRHHPDPVVFPCQRLHYQIPGKNNGLCPPEPESVRGLHHSYLPQIPEGRP